MTHRARPLIRRVLRPTRQPRARDTEGAGCQRAVRVALALALDVPIDEEMGRIAWNDVLDVATQEKLAVLAWLRGGAVIRAAAPPHVVRRWRGVVLAAHAFAERQWTALGSVLALFDANGIEAVVLKGMPLSERLYADPLVRMVTDADLYIDAKDRARARALLLADGWSGLGGAAPCDEEYGRGSGASALFLELHSEALTDCLRHIAAPPPQSQRAVIRGMPVPVHCGVLQAAHLAAHLATHQLPPLLWLVDFATFWTGLSPAERDSAVVGAREVGLHRYLRRAVSKAVQVERAARGDACALRALGIGPAGRRGTHSVWAHLRCSPGLIAGVRLLGAVAVPHAVRVTGHGYARSAWRRLRLRWHAAWYSTMRYGA